MTGRQMLLTEAKQEVKAVKKGITFNLKKGIGFN